MRNSDKLDILEERCNMQERKLLELYHDLAYFENLSKSQDFEQMQGKLTHAQRKAETMRSGLRAYLTRAKLKN